LLTRAVVQQKNACDDHSTRMMRIMMQRRAENPRDADMLQ